MTVGKIEFGPLDIRPTKLWDYAPPPPLMQILRTDSTPQRIIIGNGLVTIDLETGKHTFAEDADIDEAARLFWEAVSRQIRG